MQHLNCELNAIRIHSVPNVISDLVAQNSSNVTSAGTKSLE